MVVKEAPIYDLSKLNNPREKRLAREHMKLHELCEHSPRLSYEIEPRRGRAPEVYHVFMILKSIIGLDEEHNPIYGYEHSLKIDIPAGYPNTARPKCYMETPIWHPNVKWEGKFKGRVCVNTEDLGPLFYLDDLVLRVGKILQYKNYHAENVQPYPEDERVAQWVRDFAEPKGLINKEKGIYIDGTSLMGPIPDWEDYYGSSQEEEEEISDERTSLKIIKRRPNTNTSADSKISIKRKKL